MRRALLVVDMQVAILPQMWNGDALAERIGALADQARAAGVPVVYLQQDGAPDTPFAPGTSGWELDPRVRAGDEDIVIRKTATDSSFRTDLELALHERDVDTVIVAGVASDFCVDPTVRAVLSRGFDVQLVADGHSTADRPGLAARVVIAHHNGVLAFGTHPGGTVTLPVCVDVFDGDAEAVLGEPV